MKIKSLKISNHQPIKNLELDNLGSIVIIAGANGAGKTRLKQAIIQTLREATSPVMDLTLVATRPEEKDKYFQSETLEVKNGERNTTLQNYIKSRQYGGGKYVGSLVQIDSQRNIQTVQYNAVNWLGTDPDDQDTPNTFYFQDFTDRWQDFMNYIHQKSAVRDKKIAQDVKSDPSKNGAEIIKNNPDPLEKYKQIFSTLLPGKELQDIDPAKPREFSYKDKTGEILPFGSLSSGEQEVVKVVFDVVRKDIKHSIIIVDEPELHLHPTLTFKLVETLKTIGDHTNQFIFLTHSADLISTYYSTGDVYFIDADQTGVNQAHRLSDLNHTHKELVQLIGDNLGLFAVGKTLIFVEGENASIDRVTYQTIAQKILPEAKVVALGSVENIITLNTLEEQIRNSIFGINFYMVRDRDGLSASQIQEVEKGGRIKCLKRRQIENYFLDAEILFKVSEALYLTSTNPQLSVEFIEAEIKRLATDALKTSLLKNTKEYLALNHFFKIPTVRSLAEKTEGELKSELVAGVQASLQELSTNLADNIITEWLNVEEQRLKDALQTQDWRNEFHGKVIFARLCGEVLGQDPVRVRQAYVDIALRDKPDVFEDITTIFASFNQA